MTKKTEAEMKDQSLICSNPNCGRVFDNPIIVQNLSSQNETSYHACPHCLTEIVTEKTPKATRKEERKGIKTKEKRALKTKEDLTELAQQPFPEEHKCPHSFGYLSQRSKNEEIPEECMTCEKIVQCMLDKVTG